jgi:hypothetical protein
LFGTGRIVVTSKYPVKHMDKVLYAFKNRKKVPVKALIHVHPNPLATHTLRMIGPDRMLWRKKLHRVHASFLSISAGS